MPPLQAPKFFIGLESPKDGWVTSLDQKEKTLVTNKAKEEFRELNLMTAAV